VKRFVCGSRSLRVGRPLQRESATGSPLTVAISRSGWTVGDAGIGLPGSADRGTEAWSRAARSPPGPFACWPCATTATAPLELATMRSKSKVIVSSTPRRAAPTTGGKASALCSSLLAAVYRSTPVGTGPPARERAWLPTADLSSLKVLSVAQDDRESRVLEQDPDCPAVTGASNAQPGPG